MGLFDIFKRRSKKEQETKEEPVKTPEDHAENTTPDDDPETVVKSVADQPDHSEDAIDEEPDESTESVKVNTQEENNNTEATPKVLDNTSSEVSDSEPESVVSDEVVTNSNNQEDQAEIEHVTSESKDSQEPPVEAELASENHEQNSEAINEKNITVKTTTEVELNNDQDQPENETETTNKDDDQIYERGLAKSRSTLGQRLNKLFANFRSVDESFFDDLEDMLIESDVGYEMALQITDELRDEVKLRNVKKAKEVQNVVVKKMIDIYDNAGNGESNEINMAKEGPTVILFVGVNGVGKTTTIGKMAKMYKDQGKKVLLAAADTFRAGAIQQLNVWAERDGVDIVKGKEQGDPAAVVFDGVKKAKSESYDILMVDTAGRLQNKVNLMNELAKMKKVITREIPDAPQEVLLVLDGTTGQNALNQAKLFKEATDVTGIVLTKLDGTAKGGIVLAIRSELHLPVKYVGLGEKVTDLREFNANDFVYGLFKGLISE